MQIIFHIDLNAFYASAEMANDSSLEGKPLVISGNNRRAIVSTASYQAIKYGIHSAMPLFQAKQLCKNLIIKPVNFDLYRRLSSQFFDLYCMTRFSLYLLWKQNTVNHHLYQDHHQPYCAPNKQICLYLIDNR